MQFQRVFSLGFDMKITYKNTLWRLGQWWKRWCNSAARCPHRAVSRIEFSLCYTQNGRFHAATRLKARPLYHRSVQTSYTQPHCDVLESFGNEEALTRGTGRDGLCLFSSRTGPCASRTCIGAAIKAMLISPSSGNRMYAHQGPQPTPAGPLLLE